MKAYGRRNRLKYNYANIINDKEYVNWWEVEMDDVCKKRDRQAWKKEIRWRDE